MGANRKMAQPESYPAAFLAAVRSGAGVILTEDLPWTTISSAKRFRLLLALLKEKKSHPLHLQAMKRWSVQAESRALIVSAADSAELVPRLSAAIIERALST